MSSILTKEVIMTKKELAQKLKIDVKTLDSWEEKRPEVMRLIRIGLAKEEHIEEIERYIKIIKNESSNN